MFQAFLKNIKNTIRKIFRKNKTIVLKWDPSLSQPIKISKDRFQNPKSYSIRVKRQQDGNWEVVDFKEHEPINNI